MVALLAAILLPWLLFEAEVTRWLGRVGDEAGARPGLVAGVVIVLLAGDVVLPVPSSVVAVLAGASLGLLGGTVTIWVGLMAGSIAGYGLGRRAGERLPQRLLNAADRAALERLFGTFGPAVVAATRPVPVLAEAAVLLAGAGRMPWAAFLGYAALANLGVALAWGGVGALAMDAGSFLVAFLGLVSLPSLTLLVWRLARRNKD